MFRRIVWSTVVALLAVDAARAATMKYHQLVVSPGGQTVAEFTTIRNTNAVRFPYAERDLYKDDSGRLLVIRRNYASSTNFATTYYCVATGETLELDETLQDSVTLVLGNHSLLIKASDVGMNATSLPPSIASQVGVFSHFLSTACRDALHRLSEIGSYYSVELNSDATELRGILFSDVPNSDPADPSLLKPRLNIVNPFDPSQTPPDAFEQQFGSAYYQ